MKILLDSNILIYSLNKGSNYYTKAVNILGSRKNFCIAEQNIIEAYRVITSNKQFADKVYTPSKAWKQLGIIVDNVPMIFKSERTLGLLQDLVLKYKLVSYQIYDAALVALMIENGVNEIYTNNDKDFKKFKEIKVINPFTTA